MGKTFALLIGIDDYPAEVGKLSGCRNDVDNVQHFLVDHCADPAIEVLKDGDATYANVIAQIRKHLGQAAKDDVALLHYCGHGARSGAAPEFHPFDLDNRDEGLVCIDSRNPDMFDLADKELALLISELAARDPHIAVVLDCCHSGTGTRDLEPGVRGTGAGNFPRQLDTYLEGQYARALARGALVVPHARHILMAACDRSETAKEDLETRGGLFTTVLYDLLRQTGGEVTYADLFTRTRSAVRRTIRDKGWSSQEPQFEPIAGFDAFAGFLGRAARRGRRTFTVSQIGGAWVAEAGATSGISTDPATVTLALSPLATPDVVAGSARVVEVGGATSVVVPDFAADPAAHYVAHITSMPRPPLPIAFAGYDAARDRVAQALTLAEPQAGMLCDPGDVDAGYAIRVEHGALEFSRSDDGRAIARLAFDAGADWSAALNASVAHVATWQRRLALANPRPQLDPRKLDFCFARDGDAEPFHGPAFTLGLKQDPVSGEWQGNTGRLVVRNRTGQLLNFVLLWFSNDFAVKVFASGQIVPDDDFMTIPIALDDGTTSPDLSLWLDDRQQTVERFKLVLGVKPIDGFMLELDPLMQDRGVGSPAQMRQATRPITDDWFTCDMRIRLVEQRDAIGPQPVRLMEGAIVIEGHSAVTANLALLAPLGGARGVAGDVDFAGRLAQAGIVQAGAGCARGLSADILDITDIAGAETLQDQPLRLRLNLPVGDDEVIVPLVHDGEHVLLAGDFWRDTDGQTHVSIDHLPASQVDQRSLGGALRMYLFKTGFGLRDVNRLRRVTFSAAGEAVYRGDGMATAVRDARRVLLVIHGIIGDTTSIVAGVRAAGIDSGFDCILAYDYENLSTPIEQTAKQLRDDLAGIGLAPGHGPSLTILAHSMGGLVARQFIEREGGAAVVDHLVMCGTPNLGSPFGEVDKARHVLTGLATIGVNFALPFSAGALCALAASRKLTPTLEEMAPGSAFIARLNATTDRATRYTILAGNVADYQAPDRPSFDRLLTKITRSAPFGALFGGDGNDIAVAVHSIRLDDGPGHHPAVRADVACHHLNYFSSAAGLDALRAVTWGT